mgnify:CR=1 FL=1
MILSFGATAGAAADDGARSLQKLCRELSISVVRLNRRYRVITICRRSLAPVQTIGTPKQNKIKADKRTAISVPPRPRACSIQFEKAKQT